MDEKDEKKGTSGAYIVQLRQKVTDYTSNKVQGLKNETVGVLKDFSTKDGLLENSKKMHPLRVYAMIFIIFTLLLTTIASVLNLLNGLSSGHDFKDLHIGATFNWGSIVVLVLTLVVSFLYLWQSYRKKRFVWISALFTPILAISSLCYITKCLSWYGIGADVAQGCANFAAILSVPPLLLELSVTGHLQKATIRVIKFFLRLKHKKVQTTRIVAIAVGLVTLFVKTIDLIYLGTKGIGYMPSFRFSIWFFGPMVLSWIIYVLMCRKHYKFTWVCPIVFAALGISPTLIIFIKDLPLADLLSYTSIVLSSIAIILELIGNYVEKAVFAQKARTQTDAPIDVEVESEETVVEAEEVSDGSKGK